jgi:hypothetical protein
VLGRVSTGLCLYGRNKNCLERKLNFKKTKKTSTREDKLKFQL